MSLKSAFDAALTRATNMEKEFGETKYGQKKVVKTPRDTDIYGDLPDDFFVDDLPNRICGSRALSDEQRAKEFETRRDEKRPWWEKNMTTTRDNHDNDYLDQDQIAAIYEGPFLSYSGYSTMNRNIVKSLLRAGVTVRTNVVKTQEKVHPEQIDFFNTLSSTYVPKDVPHIYGMTVPTVVPGGYSILYTMMETSNTVHPKYVGKLNLAREVWVPTDYAKNVFESSGVNVPVRVMPLGIDPDLYNDIAAPMSLSCIKESFKFLSVFNWGFRKGYDVLLRNFFRAFTSDDDVCLVVCSQLSSGENGQQKISKVISQYRKEAMSENPDPPKAYLIYDDIPEEKMPSLYRACDAFVLISRGEGMGLPYLEAGACYVPVIASNCTAQSCYLNEGNAYLIDPDGYAPTKLTDPPSTNMAKSCYFYEDQPFPVFGRKANEKLINTFRKVRYDYDDSRSKASALGQLIHSQYTWDMAAVKIRTRLEEIKQILISKANSNPRRQR